MANNVIYVLHETGADSHYNALVTLAKQKNANVRFYEFRLFVLLKLILKKKYKLKKWVADLFFLARLPFMKRSKVIVGIAPFNPTLKRLMWILKKHDIYYHTSYTHWDSTLCAYPIRKQAQLEDWKLFTNKYAKHIFAVSEKTKDEMIKNGFATEDRITVVNHSYNIPIAAHTPHPKNNTFIFVGRVIKEKGIEELLSIFSERKNARLIIVGEGYDMAKVKDYAEKHDNIVAKGYVKGLKNLIPLYESASFVVMNSHRTKSWEELFGIALIEGMACGCVPITTDHPGPNEIITQQVNGIICKEGHIADGIDAALAMSDNEYQRMRLAAIQRGQSYTSDKMAVRWNKIFD